MNTEANDVIFIIVFASEIINFGRNMGKITCPLGYNSCEYL